MTKKVVLPESPLTGLDLGLSPEEDLALNLEYEAERFRSDPTNPLRAFMALAYIVAYWWGKEEDPPHNRVEIPWWVAHVLAEGFHRYRDSAQSIAPMSLGEAYQLEGGQGSEPKMKIALRELRDTRIVLAIAFLRAEDLPLEQAIQRLADLADLSADRVEKIWK